MVRVATGASDQAMAWRVRDSLAAHPLLGGRSADIEIMANRDGIVLEGWTADNAVLDLAVKMALRAAGRRSVSTHLEVLRYRGWQPAVQESLMQRL